MVHDCSVYNFIYHKHKGIHTYVRTYAYLRKFSLLQTFIFCYLVSHLNFCSKPDRPMKWLCRNSFWGEVCFYRGEWQMTVACGPGYLWLSTWCCLWKQILNWLQANDTVACPRLFAVVHPSYFLRNCPGCLYLCDSIVHILLRFSVYFLVNFCLLFSLAPLLSP